MFDEKELKTEIKRKLLQLNVSLRENVQYEGLDYYNDLKFLQNNLSSVSPDDVDLETNFLGQKLNFPLMISPLVGGFKDALKINENLAKIAEEHKIIMGIGDQIYGIAFSDLKKTYSIARETAPETSIFGNLWAKHLSKADDYIDTINQAIDIVNANAFEITLNPLTELFYYKSESRGAKISQFLTDICDNVDIPIIVKSLESGFCQEDVAQLWDSGVDGIDSQGMGGTDLIKLENLKHMSLAEKQSSYQPKVFDAWGLHTLWSLMDIKLRKNNASLPLIVGGGIRNGLQATKCLALGADIVSIGYPALVQAIEDIGYPDEKNLKTFIHRLIYEIKMVFASLGARNVKELREVCNSRLFIKGESLQWMNHRNLKFPMRK